ncbi:MAG: hypothetical protein J6Y94_08950 [Bacteriovoracaceae bacterium]|nr:hypothetical protein [Bacteriovoracaceae bacterium]
MKRWPITIWWLLPLLWGGGYFSSAHATNLYETCAAFMTAGPSPLDRATMAHLKHQRRQLTYSMIPRVIRQSSFMARWEKIKKNFPPKKAHLILPGDFGKHPSAALATRFAQEYQNLVSFLQWIRHYDVICEGQVDRYLSYLTVIGAALHLADQGVAFNLYYDPHLQKESYLILATTEESKVNHPLNQLAQKLFTQRHQLRLAYAPEENLREDSSAIYQPAEMPNEEHFLYVTLTAPFQKREISPVLWHELVHVALGDFMQKRQPYPFYGTILLESPWAMQDRHASPREVFYLDESTAYWREAKFALHHLEKFIRQSSLAQDPKSNMREFKFLLSKVIDALTNSWDFNNRQSQFLGMMLSAVQAQQAQVVQFPLANYGQVHRLVNRKKFKDGPSFWASNQIIDQKFSEIKTYDDLDFLLLDANHFPPGEDLSNYLYFRIKIDLPRSTFYLAIPRMQPPKANEAKANSLLQTSAYQDLITHLQWAAQVAAHQKAEAQFVLAMLLELESSRAKLKRLNPQLANWFATLNMMLSRYSQLGSPGTAIQIPRKEKLEKRFQEIHRWRKHHS